MKSSNILIRLLTYSKQHANIFLYILHHFVNSPFKLILVRSDRKSSHLFECLSSIDSLDNVQLWIVNQAAHALFYTLYAVYPCNFLVYIQREFQRTENLEILEHILFPMFQRVRFNRCLISSDRKRELDKEKRLRQDSCHIIYEARKLSLDPLFGREPPVNSNWMHHEMKRILPFYQFKRKRREEDDSID